ncbi:MAG TPA: DegT/DnrJ/EryC1/StrS family aminotransferase [Bdellovibrionales bacterium]|nr:DegT/DnrJ/EryC1/StrS family aminotransferase [Bdellovibrionales bacterium]
MRREFLSLSPPALSESEIESVMAVLRAGNWLTSGPKTKEFEQKFQAKVGAKAALALNSCTAGLHLSMVVHRVGQGDEVITTPLTFAATANVVEHVGGTVRLADIDPETLLIDPEQVARAVTPKTKVIVPVHYAGQPCDMPRIRDIAGAKIRIVEDAAHCLPSKIGAEWIGAADNLALFSFYATKNITTGEGGMMTGRPELVDEARRLALHGLSRDAWNRFAKGGSWEYDVPEPGYKYNLTDIASAMGVAQLDRLDELYEARMRIVNAYDQAFKNTKHFRAVKTREGVLSSHHLYVILLELGTLTIDRNRFINELAERNIGTSVHYTPVHMFSYYAKKYGWTPESFPNAHRAFTRMLSLPLSSKMNPNDAADVIEAVNDVCRKFAK